MNEKGYTLYIVEGDLVRKYNTEEFQKREITIGSGGADILVESNTISKIHLRINLRNNKLYFADTDSREGSFMYNNTAFTKLESVKYYKKEGQDTVLRLGDSVLVIIADNRGESEYLKANIERGVSIGRSRDNDIVLNHFGISQRHAQILPAEKGNIDMLYVYGNKRTFVNGQEVENEQVLRNCDYIQILNFTLIYFNSFVIYKKVFDGANAELHNIVKSGSFRKKVLDDVSFRIDSNEFAAVIGGSGAGKTELLNVLKGSRHGVRKGDVYFNGLDLLNNIDMLKEVIGYVPQESILHEELSLKTCMRYAMKLKSYENVQDKELDRRIESVLDLLEIISYSDVPVKNLEADVRKRADIAMELSGNPGLLLLDEPTLNLDNETEKKLLRLLRDIAKSMSKTIVIASEKIKLPELFDKIIFMGEGGKICFCGTLDEAKMFFDTESVTDILHMLEENSDYWSEQYKNYFTFNITPNQRKKSKLKPKVSNKKQFGMLLKRDFTLLFRGNILKWIMTILLPVLCGILPYLIPNEYHQWTQLILLTGGAWLGLFNAVSQICRERIIFRRECSGNLKIPLYLSAKYILQIIFAFIESALATITISLTTGFSALKTVLLSDPLFDTFAVILLIILSSAASGLLISSLLKKTAQIPLAFITAAAAEFGALWAILTFCPHLLLILPAATLLISVSCTLITLTSLSKSEE